MDNGKKSDRPGLFTVDGRKLTNARLKKGLSMREVAEAIGISKGTVSRWEQGMLIPLDENLWALAELYGTTDFVRLNGKAKISPEVAQSLKAIDERLVTMNFDAKKWISKEDMWRIFDAIQDRKYFVVKFEKSEPLRRSDERAIEGILGPEYFNARVRGAAVLTAEEIEKIRKLGGL